MKQVVALSIFFVINCAFGQLTENGDLCSNMSKPINDFNRRSYSGRWFEIHRFNDGARNFSSTTFEFSGNDTDYSVHFMGYNGDTMFHRDGVVEADSATSGTMRLNFDPHNLRYPHWVISTDYTSYSYVYSCEFNETSGTSMMYSWLLSRTRYMKPQDIVKISEKLAEFTSFEHYTYSSPEPRCNSAMNNSVFGLLVVGMSAIARFCSKLL